MRLLNTVWRFGLRASVDDRLSGANFVSVDCKPRQNIWSCNWSAFSTACGIVANIQEICLMSTAVPTQLGWLRRFQNRTLLKKQNQ